MKSDDSAAVATIHTLSWQHAYKGILDQEFLDSIDIQKREMNWRKGIEANDPPLIRAVLEEEGNIVGFACGLENRSKEELPHCDCELWAIYVHPQQARKGTGLALLKYFSVELKRRGKNRFCVWTLKENKIARSFYERHGGTLSEVVKETKIGNQSLIEVAYEFEL